MNPPRQKSLARKIDDQVGQKIRARRVEVGLTQQQLARILKLSYQQVQKYETGANRVSAGRLYEMANKLGVDVAYFFKDVAPTRESVAAVHGGRNRQAIDLVRSFSELSNPAVKAALVALVRDLAGHG
jgi:transcriptional regulator with XRE-family HTH domain